MQILIFTGNSFFTFKISNVIKYSKINNNANQREKVWLEYKEREEQGRDREIRRKFETSRES